jgi:hypothetical protein
MFFSVKSAVKIAGKVYVPCVCYALPEALKPTLDKMVKEGKAYIYDHKVAFQNGKVIEKDSSEVINAPDEGFEKKHKKAKKEDIKEEEIPSPEEVAEGF